MKFDITFLRSKVARRIFMLFVCCAMIPITALAILSFTHVTNQLNEQSRRRLHQATKAVGMAIVERLMFLETEMKMVASNFSRGLGHTIETTPQGFGERLEQRFRAIAVLRESHGHVSFFGHIENSPKPTEAELEHMSAGNTVVWSQYSPGLPSRVFMMRSVDPQDPTMGCVLGEINTSHLWGIGQVNTLPPMTGLCVVDPSNNVLFSSLPVQAPFGTEVGTKTDGSTSRQFEWKHEGKEYLASWWTIFLKMQFLTPKWTVVLSQSKADVLAPMANFKKIFPLVVLISLWVVLLFSIIQIRRNLVPLEKLKEGTLRIAKRDFDTRVTVSSGDEFEELAGSFNTMSGQLDRQFKALATIREIDQAILSALDTERIVDTVLTRMHGVFTCDAVSVSL
jgi:HAMP domain-containing protein